MFQSGQFVRMQARQQIELCCDAGRFVQSQGKRRACKLHATCITCIRANSLVLLDRNYFWSPQISVDDEITIHLCQLCADRLTDLHQFYLMYMESARKLNEVREILKTTQKANAATVDTTAVETSADHVLCVVVESEDENTKDHITVRTWECYRCRRASTTREELSKHLRSCGSTKKSDIEFVSIETFAIEAPKKIRSTNGAPKFHRKQRPTVGRTNDVPKRPKTNGKVHKHNDDPVLVTVKSVTVKPHHNLLTSYDVANEPKYRCDLCDAAAFARIADFKKHMFAAHAEDRLHACEMCPKRFKTVGHAENHRLMHANLKGGKTISLSKKIK